MSHVELFSFSGVHRAHHPSSLFSQLHCPENVRLLEERRQHAAGLCHMERWRALLLCNIFHELHKRNDFPDGTTLVTCHQSHVSRITVETRRGSSNRDRSPTLVLTVILSCRLVLNLRTTHAKLSSPANSSGPMGSDPTKNRSPVFTSHNRGISHEKAAPYMPRSEWIDISSGNRAKLEDGSPWPDPFPDGVGDHPARIV